MGTDTRTAGGLTDQALEAVRAAITGKVFLPGEPGYDQARQAWNLAVDERPRPSEMVSWPEGG